MTTEERIAELEQRIEYLKAKNATLLRVITSPPADGAIPVNIPLARWEFLEREMGMAWIEEWLLGAKYQPPPGWIAPGGKEDELAF